MRYDTITGYIYEADIYCPACMGSEKMVGILGAMDARAHGVEYTLDKKAKSMHIDRSNETSFDSDDFPKVIHAFEVALDEFDRCGACGKRLS